MPRWEAASIFTRTCTGTLGLVVSSTSLIAGFSVSSIDAELRGGETTTMPSEAVVVALPQRREGRTAKELSHPNKWEETVRHSSDRSQLWPIFRGRVTNLSPLSELVA